MFKSWDNPRAAVYRRVNNIPDDLGTAVNVMQMVFGNIGDDLRHGRRFTRNPATGEQASSTATSSSTPRARTSWPASAPRARSPS